MYMTIPCSIYKKFSQNLLYYIFYSMLEHYQSQKSTFTLNSHFQKLLTQIPISTKQLSKTIFFIHYQVQFYLFEMKKKI